MDAERVAADVRESVTDKIRAYPVSVDEAVDTLTSQAMAMAIVEDISVEVAVERITAALTSNPPPLRVVGP